MRITKYGQTEKNVSVVGFGGMRFDSTRSNEENAELLHYAAEKGITYFDTAPGYCADKSEDIFGIAFRDMPADVYISTKGMPTSFDTADKAREAVRKSMDRLGVDKIHFYHVWCLRKLEHFELALRPGGQYEGLLQCREEGLIDHIVCSTHMPGPEIAKVVESGKFEGVLMGINILNFPYRWDGMIAAQSLGRAVVAMNPLGGGIIPQNDKDLGFLCSGDESPTEAALRFNIACPQITISLVGFTTKEHIDMACRIADEAAPMTDEELDAIQKNLGENMDEVCTGCGYCRDCPQNIPVPSYMQYYNGKALLGKSDDEMVKDLNFDHNWGLLVGRAADAAECVECGQCEEACTQHLPIIKRLAEIADWEKRSG
jgi:predicted aldo/keto reductase-like oxidoreductase